MKRLKIAVDFDETITADRELWRVFIDEAKARGHDVRIVTFRSDYYPAFNEDIYAFANEMKVPIIFSSSRQKRTAWKADIWIDDMPELIPTKTELKNVAHSCELSGE